MNVRTSPGRNLAPADLKKDANGFDLPIALGLLVGSGQVSFDRPDGPETGTGDPKRGRS